MELFRIHKTIPFMKYSKILNAISFISFFIAIGLLVVRGLAFSIEFTGGLVMEVNYPDAVPVQELRVDLEKATGGEVQVVNFGTARDAQIRLPLKGNKTSAQMSEEVMKVIHEKAPEAQLRRTEFVGPQVGEELATDGLTALLLVIVGIMIYLAFRFEWSSLLRPLSRICTTFSWCSVSSRCSSGNFLCRSWRPFLRFWVTRSTSP